MMKRLYWLLTGVKYSCLPGVLLAMLLALAVTAPSAVWAQADVQWSQPQPIQGYEDLPQYNTQMAPPHMVVRPDGTVLAFNSQWVQGNLAIVYSEWSQAQGWTTPVDILLSPTGGQARIMDVLLDDAGTVHLIFFGGDDRAANIYYTTAPVKNAGRAQSWATPTIIGPQAVTPSYATMNGNGSGRLMVVYSGRPEGNGVFAAQSTDSGRTWSDPTPLFLTYDEPLFPASLTSLWDSNGRFHVFWAVANKQGNAEAIYYARYEGATNSWAEAEEFVPAINFEADTPAVVEHNRQLMVIYHNDFPTTRWMRISEDGGETWSEPTRLFDHVGSNGPVSFGKDAGDTLHLFFGNRMGNPAIHGLWHSIWQEGAWQEPTAVVAGNRIIDERGGNGFDPSFARGVVVNGNVALVTWNTDPGAGPNGIWYSFGVLDAPYVAPVEATPVSPTSVAEAEVDNQPENDNVVSAGVNDAPGPLPSSNDAPVAETDSALILYLSVIPAIGVVLITVAVQLWRSPR